MFQFLAQYDYSTTPDISGAQATGIFAFFAAYSLFVLALAVVGIIALWKIFEKAGIPGWKAIIPIYNMWLLFQMSGKPGWWALVILLAFIPVINFIAGPVYFVLWILAALELGKAFGKDTVFSVVLLIIFSIVGFLILGFGKDKYTKPATAPAQFS
jgi:hypothetical protein